MNYNLLEYAHKSGNPYLLGAYAPIFEEVVAEDLPVIGQIPEDIHGVYARNGPNPKYTPKGHYHWFDGDGMIHAVHIQNGKVTYRNRWVRTEALLREDELGETIWQGVMGNLYRNPDDGHLRLKDSANTALAFHNQKLLAGWYMCGSLYAIDPITLETLGQESCQGTLQSRVMAHTKKDEYTQELMFFDYGPRPPFLSYGVIGADGKVKHFTHIDLPGPRLPHDMGITQNYSILMDLPLVHNEEALRAGKSSLIFREDMPSRFAILPRFGTNEDVQWFEAKACFMYHVCNAWEEGDEVVLDCCITSNPTPQKKFRNPIEKLNAYLRLEARLYRYRFNLKTGEVKEGFLDDRYSEFPMINAYRMGRKTQYTYNQHFDLSEKLRFDGLIKYDTSDGSAKIHFYGEGKFGSEAPFVPRKGGTEEDDGYLVSFVTDERNNTSELIILDAQNVEQEPIARVLLPQRVPLGFHACWVDGAALN